MSNVVYTYFLGVYHNPPKRNWLIRICFSGNLHTVLILFTLYLSDSPLPPSKQKDFIIGQQILCHSKENYLHQHFEPSFWRRWKISPMLHHRVALLRQHAGNTSSLHSEIFLVLNIRSNIIFFSFLFKLQFLPAVLTNL